MFTRAYTSSTDDLMSEPFGTRIYFNASTSTLARDGMSLRPDRWRLENYHRAGGPVLWAHKHDMPAIGSGQGKTDPSRLRVGVVFDQEDPFAKSVESKVRRKFIRGSSVGWDFVTSGGEVIKNSRAFTASLTRDAFYDLSELSIVNVPSDPHAVSERQWKALRSIDPGLAEMYDAQERWDSDVTAPQLRSALIDYCEHLGLDLGFIRGATEGSGRSEDYRQDDLQLSDQDEGEEPHRGQSPAFARARGLNADTANRSVPLPTRSTTDSRAARTVRSAFALR